MALVESRLKPRGAQKCLFGQGFPASELRKMLMCLMLDGSLFAFSFQVSALRWMEVLPKQKACSTHETDSTEHDVLERPPLLPAQLLFFTPPLSGWWILVVTGCKHAADFRVFLLGGDSPLCENPRKISACPDLVFASPQQSPVLILQNTSHRNPRSCVGMLCLTRSFSCFA